MNTLFRSVHSFIHYYLQKKKKKRHRKVGATGNKGRERGRDKAWLGLVRYSSKEMDP